MKIAHRARLPLPLPLCLGLLMLGCAERQGTDAASVVLDESRQLQVTVEGETELRAARLFESPQNYAIYVLPQIVMTPEEPYRDQAFARIDGEFFMRIERLPAQADTADLRANAAMALAHIGEVRELHGEQIFDPQFRDADFYLHAATSQVSVDMFVTEIDGSRFRLTMHIPNREPAEGIVPSLWAMLRSIRTLGPLPEEHGGVL